VRYQSAPCFEAVKTQPRQMTLSQHSSVLVQLKYKTYSNYSLVLFNDATSGAYREGLKKRATRHCVEALREQWRNPLFLVLHWQHSWALGLSIKNLKKNGRPI
jgi:hypothetical protein